MRVKYVGEPVRKMIKAPGRVLEIRCRCKDGKRLVMKAADKAVGIAVNDIIDLGVVDARIARHMAADPRFQIIP